MPDYLTCFACEREPTRQCSRCGRPYCDEHGEELCDVCLQPASGVPSFTLYRGSLLALLVGTALAVWLLVQPSGGASEGLRPVILTPTSAAAAAQTPGGGQTPGAAQTPATTGTPGTPAATVSGTPSPRPSGTTSPTPAGTTTAGGSYTVVSGDTLSTICSKQRPALATTDCVTQIKTLNRLTSDDISVGDKLTLP